MPTKRLTILLTVVLLLGTASCSKKDDSAENQRLAQEQQDERDAAAANKAISEMNKKAFGRKPPALDLGLPPVTDNGTAQIQPPQP